MNTYIRIGVCSLFLTVIPVDFAIAGVITQIHSPATEVVFPNPVSPNNDGPGTFFQNAITWDVTLNAALDYVDIVIDVSDSGGTTEYFVSTDIHLPNSAVGGTWQRFELQIRGDNLPAGLNLDTDDGDFLHGRGLLASEPDMVSDHIMQWNNINLSVFVPQLFHELDIPDSSISGGGSYSFTLRYYPVVPEPTTVVSSVWAALLIGLRRRSYRFSNQR